MVENKAERLSKESSANIRDRVVIMSMLCKKYAEIHFSYMTLHYTKPVRGSGSRNPEVRITPWRG
jgi:hypothetical protein